MKPSILLLAACIAVYSSGCSKMFKGKATAEKAVADFHQLYNQGKWEQIYDNADAKFRQTSPKKTFVDLVEGEQVKLGKETASAETGYKEETINTTTTVVLNQDTTFEQGKGTETFTFEMNGGKAMLVGYHMQFNDAVKK